MMTDNPLKSLENYSRFVTELVSGYPIEHSTIIVWSESAYTGVATGEAFFAKGFRLRMREELDFEAGLITSYGYEAYQHDEKIFWYDDFPHPNELSLASSFPHHKHVPPDIKHNRIPAPEMSFTQPNLSVLIDEIKWLIKAK
ncbi:DUF6516 family protein [Candidatus Marithioploca araucensis]|uniref:DUF6516 family protein n=1 Tax=Candidatus Marithioploca araucensis TaxID=70273 RepID=A0ABT7VVW7_9GAMM|nr:DUF6516 family protein [Candidatus Marithioploca araucensis]